MAMLLLRVKATLFVMSLVSTMVMAIPTPTVTVTAPVHTQGMDSCMSAGNMQEAALGISKGSLTQAVSRHPA